MPGRSKRHFDPTDAQRLLDALEEARRACTEASRKAPIRGDVYLASERVVEAIDEVALVLTGKRDYFWLKGY